MSGAVQSSCLLTDRACYTNKKLFGILAIQTRAPFFLRSRLGSRSRSPSKGPSGFGIVLGVVAEVPTELEDGTRYGNWQKGRDSRSSRGSSVEVEGAPQ